MSRKAGLHVEDYKVVNESVERETQDADNGLNQQQENSEGLKMQGLALPFKKRSRNGVIYEKESVKKAASTLKGCPVLFNHDENNTIGHIVSTEVKDDGLYYKADLNPERKEVESLERGDIPHVSIQALIEETEKTDTRGEVGVTEFLEMSAVTIPGFPSTDVETGEETVMIEKLVDNEESLTESLENPEFEVGDFVEWEFGEGTSQGEVIDRKTEVGDSMSAGGNEFTIEEGDGPLYKMEEWDEEEGEDGEFTNNVVKFEDALSSADRPDAAEESGTSKEPFADYDDFEDCVSQNQDKDDAEAYCAAIKRKTEKARQIKQVNEALSDVDLTPPEKVVNAAQAALDAKEEFDKIADCGTGVGESRARSIVNDTLQPEDFLGGENTAIPDYLESHEEDLTTDKPPTDWNEQEWTDGCGNVQYALWGYYREWADETEQELRNAKEKILGDSPMKNQEELTEKITEQLEEVDEDDFTGTVADMYEEVSASDAASLMEDFSFTGSPEPLVALVADLADMTPADLMEVLESDMEIMDDDEDEDDMEDEGQYGDMEDDEEEESKSSYKNESSETSSQRGNNMSSKSREELEDKVENQEEKIKELQEQIENLEGVEESKQDNPVDGSDSSGPTLREDVKNRLSRR